MSFDLSEVTKSVAEHGSVMRVVVARVRGSAPREAGASMLVWPGGQSGTIGGGALEFDAAKRALREEFVVEIPLGPSLGQCCGGSVTLVAERWTAQRLNAQEHHVLRRVRGDAECPMSLLRAAREHRNGAGDHGITYSDGWLFEPITRATRDLWVYGAGHVGRALVNVIAPLPQVQVTWIDTAMDRFPKHTLANVTALPAANPADAVALAPAAASHIILTYSHATDLEICHRLLGHGFGYAGLIGSKTKWARFRKRLLALGHSDARIAAITCPIGDPSLGKHPQQIAISVAQELCANWTRAENPLEMTA